MNRQNIKQALQLKEIVKNQNAYVTSDLYMALLRNSKRLSVLDVKTCNGEINDDDYTKKVNAIYKKITALSKEYGFDYYHQSDPRGVSLYISKEYIDGQNYNNGVAIY